jgi:hypothetical protein
MNTKQLCNGGSDGGNKINSATLIEPYAVGVYNRGNVAVTATSSVCIARSVLLRKLSYIPTKCNPILKIINSHYYIQQTEDRRPCVSYQAFTQLKRL